MARYILKITNVCYLQDNIRATCMYVTIDLSAYIFYRVKADMYSQPVAIWQVERRICTCNG